MKNMHIYRSKDGYEAETRFRKNAGGGGREKDANDKVPRVGEWEMHNSSRDFP
jgi:hypothetical protein